ncbi:MAG: hypothetical protein V1898_04900 [Patescibacteria group bacterium]
MKKVLFLGAALLLLAGCATTDSSDTNTNATANTNSAATVSTDVNVGEEGAAVGASITIGGNTNTVETNTNVED